MVDIREGSAANLRWGSQMGPHLRRHEWPAGALEWMEPRVVLALAALRETAGLPVYPSPVLGAHVRHRARRSQMGDRHSTDERTRLSDGTDFFVEWAHAPVIYRVAQSMSRIRGLGIYDAMMFRGVPSDYCMMHIDAPSLAEQLERLLWVGHGREPVEYVYHDAEPARFYQLLSNMMPAG